MFERLEMIRPDPILTLSKHFMSDADPRKVDLGIGLYKDQYGNTPLMESVRIAENFVVSGSADKIYKGSGGLEGFCDVISWLLFKERSDLIEDGRVLSIQTIGGTGAVRLAAEFLKQISNDKGVWVCDPTWGNHVDIFTHVGMKVACYPYQGIGGDLNFQVMLESIKEIPGGDVVVLHGCGHNPTGFDLSRRQWGAVLEVVKERGLFPVIDMAYHGLANGLSKDAYCVELFSEHLDEMFVAYSCSKNFGLYRDRVGALVVLGKSRDSCVKAKLHLAKLARVSISSPAIHGALIVREILSSPDLKRMWEEELSLMSSRVKCVRKVLVDEAHRQGCGAVFRNVYSGAGLFSLIPVRKEDVGVLREEFSIYMLDSGRINLSGVNDDNVGYVVSSIKSLLVE
ncbi:aromatic amino acid transaminase [Halomonas sp. A11-A]|uniref:amino acid aminotransferase n=1 Tax=Halomonas sp. A11-A TaxID=2183985 RepID=UPI000D716E84|nr:aromatic amino acid transaminase [Halomonas sp. A11-A]PWV66934.1 aromatic-amino-acid transaminase [Halomonas sp. A11-A]